MLVRLAFVYPGLRCSTASRYFHNGRSQYKVNLDRKTTAVRTPRKLVNPTFSTGQDEPRPQDLSHWLEARLGSASEAGRLIDLRLAASPGLALELVPTRALTSDQGTSTYTLNGCIAMKYRGHQNFFTQPPWQTGTHRRLALLISWSSRGTSASQEVGQKGILTATQPSISPTF